MEIDGTSRVCPTRDGTALTWSTCGPTANQQTETDYAACQMCDNEKIRYVHIMEHPDLDESFDVGCVCAEKMSDDYEGPKRREAKLHNRAARKTRWLRWGYRIGNRFSTKTYATKDEAKPRCSMTSGPQPKMTTGCGPATDQENGFDVADLP